MAFVLKVNVNAESYIVSGRKQDGLIVELAVEELPVDSKEEGEHDEDD